MLSITSIRCLLADWSCGRPLDFRDEGFICRNRSNRSCHCRNQSKQNNLRSLLTLFLAHLTLALQEKVEQFADLTEAAAQ